MKYIWASITGKGCVNKGNLLIESCLREILRLPEPNLKVDIYAEKFPENLHEFDFMINPGCTTLYPDTGSLIQIIRFESIPVICFGGSIWVEEYDGKMLSGFSHKPVSSPTILKIAKRMYEPVGCRDPFTFNFLIASGIRAKLIGCPTLFNPAKRKQKDYIAFSFSRDNLPDQIKILDHLTKTHRVKVVLHEAYEERWVKDKQVEKISRPELFLDVYANAKCVVTGRLHGALPSLDGKPVFFFQGEKKFDSRLTILDFIELPKRHISEIPTLDLSKAEYDMGKVLQLKNAFLEYVAWFKEKFLKGAEN